MDMSIVESIAAPSLLLLIQTQFRRKGWMCLPPPAFKIMCGTVSEARHFLFCCDNSTLAVSFDCPPPRSSTGYLRRQGGASTVGRLQDYTSPTNFAHTTTDS